MFGLGTFSKTHTGVQTNKESGKSGANYRPVRLPSRVFFILRSYSVSSVAGSVR